MRIGLIRNINIKTLYFNFKYLPFKDALKLPIFISSNVYLLETKGEIILNCPIKTGTIQIGFGKIGIFDRKRSRSIWQVSGKVIFNGIANIGHGSKISINNDAVLELGNNFTITAETEIVAQKHIKIGNDVLMSWNCLVMDTDFHKIYNKNNICINSPQPIIIGDKVWIGCRTVILKGSNIADNSIIGANSLVNKDISSQSGIFGGNPIKFIKEDVNWQV